MHVIKSSWLYSVRYDHSPIELLILHCRQVNVGRPFSPSLWSSQVSKHDEAAPRPAPAAWHAGAPRLPATRSASRPFGGRKGLGHTLRKGSLCLLF